MKRNMKLALSCAVVTWMGFSFAQMPVHAADAVYVTANAVQEDLKNDSQSKTIITREDLDRKGARNLAEALSGEQDIQINTDDMGRQTVAIRGSEPRHTLFLVDGRRLAQGLSKFHGATDEIYRLETDSIDHVEIIRGAGSAKYGPDATGGVINVVTKIPDTFGVRTNLEYSRIQASGKSQLNNFISLSTGKIGPFKGEISYGKIKTQPFLYGDHEDSMQYYGKRFPISAKASIDLKKLGTIRYDYDKIDETLQKNTELANEYNLNKNKDGYTNVYAQLRAREKAWRTNKSLTWTKSTDNADWKIRTYESEMDNDTNFLTTMTLNFLDINRKYMNSRPAMGQPYFDTFHTKQKGTEASVQVLLNENHLITLGTEYRKEEGSGTRIHVPGQDKNPEVRYYQWTLNNPSDYQEFTPSPSMTLPEGKTAISSIAIPKYINYAAMSSRSFYVSDEWTKGDNWIITPAIRYDTNSKFGTKISPKIGFTYKKTPHLRYKLNVGTGYSTPGIAELYHDWEMYEPSLNEKPPFRNGWFFKGNPNLKPERSLNFDVSVESERGKTRTKATIFRNNYKDFMQIVYDGEITAPNVAGFTHFDPNVWYPEDAAASLSPEQSRKLWDEIDEILEDEYDFALWRDLSPETQNKIRKEAAANVGITLSSPEEVINKLKAKFEAAKTPEEKRKIFMDADGITFAKGLKALDDVYTYKNIARARMQGIELETKHQFTPQFSMTAGYTYLDARDLDTNERLEGRGRHLFNLALQYNDKKHGFRTRLWGNYTMNYLDIRDRYETGRMIGKDSAPDSGYIVSLPKGDIHIFGDQASAEKYVAYKNDQKTYTKEKKAKEKNYGIWNLMIEKDINSNSTVYFGVNNIFGAMDEFLNLGGRVFRIGLRSKF